MRTSSGVRDRGPGSVASRPQVEAFLASAALLLHRHGTPAHRIEDTLVACAAALGIELQVFATPTSVELAFATAARRGLEGRHGRQRAHMIRSEAGEAELGRLVALDQVIAEVRTGRLSPSEGRRELLRVAAAPPPFGSLAIVLAFGVASAAAARFFAGTALDVLFSLGLGLGLGLLALSSSKRAALARLFAPLAAFAAALLSLLAEPLLGVQAHVTTLAALIVLIPGLSLTLAMTELATRHLVSGTARLAGALSVFVTMAFGVAVARALASACILAYPPEALGLGPSTLALAGGWTTALPGWTRALALALAPLGFCVLFQARRADVPAIAITGIAAAEVARLVSGSAGPELGAFAGAFTVALAANGYAAWRRLPAAVVLLPGLLLLVPGSVGFQSVTLFLANDPLAGIEAAFRMLLVAVALVAGVLAANLVALPRVRGPAAEHRAA